MRLALPGFGVALGLALIGCSGKTENPGGSSSGGASAGAGGNAAAGGNTWNGPSGVPSSPSFVNGYFSNGVFAGYAFNWLANTTAASTLSPSCVGSASCYSSENSFCTKGTLEASPDYSATAGVGFALNQAPTPNAATSDWKPTGAGLFVQLSGATSNLRVQLRALGGDTDETKRWCAPVPASGVIPWSSFNNRCWNNSGNTFTPGTPIRWIEITDPSTNASATPIDFCIVNILPYATPEDAGADAAVSENISCADWYRYPIAGTGNVLVNNVWNKQAAGSYAYHQCLSQRTTGSGTQYGWTWDWPACNKSTSYASPEVVFGRKPWDGGPSTSPDLPKRISALQNLILDFGVTANADACYNLNATMWLTNSDAAPTAADPENVNTEVMVRFDDPGSIPGCCTSDGAVTLGGITFDVWHQDAHADASDASAYTWKMVTYIGRKSTQSAQFDLALVLNDMVSRNLASASFGVQGVELITEVSGGAGKLWLDRFNVTVK